MKPFVRLLVVLTFAAGLFYVLKYMPQPESTKKATRAQSLNISPEDYEIGEKRAKAVERKILQEQISPTESLASRPESPSSRPETRALNLGQAVFIRIFKEERELELWMKGKDGYQLARTYPIAAMSGNLGPKLVEGDHQAPEGFYFVTRSQLNPNSRFHLAFNIGYPNAYDQAHGRTGSYIMVHGSNVSIGCFAMTDEKVEEIYAACHSALKAGQRFFRVHVFPFRMNPARMESAKDDPNFSFWLNLKEGYDWFEQKGMPPKVTVEGLEYAFSRSNEG